AKLKYKAEYTFPIVIHSSSSLVSLNISNNLLHHQKIIIMNAFALVLLGWLRSANAGVLSGASYSYGAVAVAQPQLVAQPIVRTVVAQPQLIAQPVVRTVVAQPQLIAQPVVRTVQVAQPIVAHRPSRLNPFVRTVQVAQPIFALVLLVVASANAGVLPGALTATELTLSHNWLPSQLSALSRSLSHNTLPNPKSFAPLSNNPIDCPTRCPHCSSRSATTCPPPLSNNPKLFAPSKSLSPNTLLNHTCPHCPGRSTPSCSYRCQQPQLIANPLSAPSKLLSHNLSKLNTCQSYASPLAYKTVSHGGLVY
ncbi:hypothetical protein Ocin01_20004, partial [Orchesella cincta]